VVKHNLLNHKACLSAQSDRDHEVYHKVTQRQRMLKFSFGFYTTIYYNIFFLRKIITAEDAKNKTKERREKSIKILASFAVK